MPVQYLPEHFIGESIEAGFNRAPLLEKKPGAPDFFIWRGQRFQRVETLQEWFDYGRRGRMGQNMREAHLSRAERKGSWGVGRFYFRVRIQDGRIFDLYYDRAPKDASDRTGSWYLWREMREAERGTSD
jgi:hypothetical protein